MMTLKDEMLKSPIMKSRIMEDLIILSQIQLPKGNDEKLLEDLQYLYNEHHNYYRFLYHLVCTFEPEVCLEIGTWYGIGSAYMCAAAMGYGGQVIGIDLNYNKLAAEVLPEHFGNYHFLQMDSLEAQEIIKSYAPLELVFQDSSHHYLESKREWKLYSPLCKSGALWLCDDITPAFHDPKVDPPGKGMVEYFNELPGEKMLFPDVLHYGNTMGLVFL